MILFFYVWKEDKLELAQEGSFYDNVNYQKHGSDRWKRLDILHLNKKKKAAKNSAQGEWTLHLKKTLIIRIKKSLFFNLFLLEKDKEEPGYQCSQNNICINCSVGCVSTLALLTLVSITTCSPSPLLFLHASLGSLFLYRKHHRKVSYACLV